MRLVFRYVKRSIIDFFKFETTTTPTPSTIFPKRRRKTFTHRYIHMPNCNCSNQRHVSPPSPPPLLLLPACERNYKGERTSRSSLLVWAPLAKRLLQLIWPDHLAIQTFIQPPPASQRACLPTGLPGIAATDRHSHRCCLPACLATMP